MKRFIIVISVVLCLLCASCSPETRTPSGTSSVVFMGETTETISDVTYTVKSYADVNSSEACFYTYYKYYYLEGKLRRIYVFSHGVGSALDHPYTDFVEHLCGTNTSLNTIYTYYENGNIESIISNYKYDSVTRKDIVSFSSDGKKTAEQQYQNGTVASETTYYTNGNTKSRKQYNTDASPSHLQSEDTYYESGNLKTSTGYYSNGQIERTYVYFDSPKQMNKEFRAYYTDGTLAAESFFYESGNEKEQTNYYTDGKVSYKYEYYDASPSVEKSYISYNPDGTKSSERTNYESGNKKSESQYDNKGQLESEYEYYDSWKGIQRKVYYRDFDGSTGENYYDSEGTKILSTNYTTSGSLSSYSYYYSSGYLKYAYRADNGNLYTYDDGKISSGTSWSADDYSSKVAYTKEQAEEFLETLIPEE